MVISQLNIHLDPRSYIGPAEHDAVDRAAKQVTLFVRITDDIYLLALSNYRNRYRKLFTGNSKKLIRIKQAPLPWTSAIRNSRREEVILTRIRMSRKSITNRNILLPPLCPHCHQQNFSVYQIFTCPQFFPLRSSLNFPSSLIKVLRNNFDTNSHLWLLTAPL